MENKLAARLFARFNALDAAGLRPLFHENITHTAPGTQFGADITGREALVKYFGEKVFPSFASLAFEIDRTYFDPTASVEFAEWHGEMHTRAGVTYQNRGIFVLEIAGGLILHMREYFDTERSKTALNPKPDLNSKPELSSKPDLNPKPALNPKPPQSQP